MTFTQSPNPVIQRDPAIKFMCITDWFRACLNPSTANYVSVGDLYEHYTAWVHNSASWHEESLVTQPVFSKHLSVLLHANNWRYSRVKREGVRGYYGVMLVPHTPDTQHKN